jgi:hypothetical protein
MMKWFISWLEGQVDIHRRQVFITCDEDCWCWWADEIVARALSS